MARVEKAKTVKTVAKKIEKPVVEEKVEETPQLVNEKNEIIYDGDTELQKLMDKVEVKEEDIKVPEAAQEAIDHLKNVDGLNEKVNENPEAAKAFAEEEIAKVEEIAKNLQKDIEERTAKLTNEQKSKLEKLQNNKRNFWNGFSDGWY